MKKGGSCKGDGHPDSKKSHDRRSKNRQRGGLDIPSTCGKGLNQKYRASIEEEGLSYAKESVQLNKAEEKETFCSYHAIGGG